MFNSDRESEVYGRKNLTFGIRAAVFVLFCAVLTGRSAAQDFFLSRKTESLLLQPGTTVASGSTFLSSFFLSHKPVPCLAAEKCRDDYPEVSGLHMSFRFFPAKASSEQGGIFLDGGLGLLPVSVEDHSQGYRIGPDFLKAAGSDFLEVLRSPARWGTGDWTTLAWITAGGAGLFVADESIQEWVQDGKSETSDDVFKFFSGLGHGYFLSALIGSLYLSGEGFHREDLRKTALLSLESWLTSGVIVVCLKFTVGRARPNTGKSATSFRPFSSGSRYYSFPSGHSASAFAVASVVADQSNKIIIDLLSYSLASLVAASRVHQNKHWASDVFIGSAIGYFVGKNISALNRGKKTTSSGLKINLGITGQSLSIDLRF